MRLFVACKSTVEAMKGTPCGLYYCGSWCTMCNLKAAQTNVQHILIQELMLYEFELVDNTVEVTKNICAKCEGAVGHSTASR